MPIKRKSTRKPAKRKKQANSNLTLVLKRLDQIAQRLEAFERNTAAEFKTVRGEMAQGLDTVRGEMAQGLDTVRGEMAQGLDKVRGEMAQGLDKVRGEMAQGLEAVRGEMAQGFDSLRQEFKNAMAHGFDSFRREFSAEMQKEFEKHGARIHQHISRVENELKAENAELRNEHRQLLTGMDVMARNYEQFGHDSAVIDAQYRDLKRDVEALKKRDMEKAAAIDKIEKEIEKLKAA